MVNTDASSHSTTVEIAILCVGRTLFFLLPRQDGLIAFNGEVKELHSSELTEIVVD